MLNLLKSIFARCPHVWREYQKETIRRRATKANVGYVVYCRCEKCGAHRQFKMVL